MWPIVIIQLLLVFAENLPKNLAVNLPPDLFSIYKHHKRTNISLTEEGNEVSKMYDKVNTTVVCKIFLEVLIASHNPTSKRLPQL